MADSHPQPTLAVDIAAAILAAPGWVRVGIAAPDRRIRERAAEALALSILEGAGRGLPPDANQLAFKI
jgi:hypothetical protein